MANDGCSEVTESSVFTTNALPWVLPTIDLTVTAADTAQPGWTLINLTNGFRGQPYTIAAVDLAGRYRWYHQRNTSHSGADTPASTFRDGVLSGGRSVPLAYVDWLGTVVWEGRDTGPTHHEVRPAREDNQILFLQDASEGDSDIVAWDIDGDEEVWRWSFGEHYTGPQQFLDWSHLNAINYFPNEDAFLVSSRSQNAIFEVDLDSENIVWGMGFCGRPDEEGFQGDFAIAEGDRFYGQHDPKLLANGNILLFDNGLDGFRNYSRAIEIEYNDSADTMTAEVVWEYRHVPDIFAPIWGNADRLANGNTLVTFGQRTTESSQLTTIVEVDADGHPVWEIELPVGWGTYRSERMTETPTGFVLSEPDG